MKKIQKLLVIILLQTMYFGFSQEVNLSDINIVDVTNNNTIKTKFIEYCNSNNIELFSAYKIYKVVLESEEFYFSEIITSEIQSGVNTTSSEVEGRFFIVNEKEEIIKNIPCYYSIVDNKYINNIKLNYNISCQWIGNGFIQDIDDYNKPCFIVFVLSPAKYSVKVITFDKKKDKFITLFEQEINPLIKNVISYTTYNSKKGFLIMNSTNHEAGNELKALSKYNFWYYDKSLKIFKYIPVDK